MGELRMSQNERTRLKVLSRVKSGLLRLVDAARQMELSYRQAKRVWRRYKNEGDAGLVHRNRGRGSNRRKPEELRRKVIARYVERYEGFGPTLAAEHLVRSDGLEVDHETLRRWLVAEGLWSRHRRRSRHRAWRERKGRLGELVQMDGSEHDWLEGRGPRAVLMVLIDDATNRTYARFYRSETTEAAFDVFGRYARKAGLPQALYVDRDSIYRSDRQARIDEELRGESALTQYGRAMKVLGVKLILANSPQAKGRVERRNGVFQDRLVKEMRLRKIETLEAANRYLEEEFLPEMNRRWVCPAREGGDLHRPIPAGLRLEEVLCWEEIRRVQNDWTVRWRNRWFQVDVRHEGLSLACKYITVRERLDGSMALLWRGEFLRFRELPARPTCATRKPPRALRKAWTPPEGHPWRQAAANQIKLKAARMGRRASATPSPACPSEKGTFLTSPNRGHF